MFLLRQPLNVYILGLDELLVRVLIVEHSNALANAQRLRILDDVFLLLQLVDDLAPPNQAYYGEYHGSP